MKRIAYSHAAQELTQLAARFHHWRDHRATRWERIPQCLWEQAVALTTVLPLSRVAKCLRVSWRDWHQHCAANHAPAVESSSTALGFVELPATPAVPGVLDGFWERPTGTRAASPLRERHGPATAHPSGL